MRLKEIKPGMVIHCKTQEEKIALFEEAERLGYRWNNLERPTDNTVYSGSTIHFYDKNEYTDFKCISWSDKTEGVTEFSDLIMPELTAEDAIKTYAEICIGRNCNMCPINVIRKGYSSCNKLCFEQPEKVVEFLEQWKSDHTKKEPEIETVDICRIIEVLPDGKKRCVHEEDIKHDPDLPYGYEMDSVHEILKRYCMEHEGEFIAVHETVSRVKAVK